MPTLLILDDDPSLQAQVTSVLRTSGVDVAPAGTAAQARTLLARGCVDAAVVGALLPDSTGLAFIAELRREYPSLPVLFTATFAGDAEAHELLARQLGVSRVLHRPYPPADLVDWFHQAVAPPPSPPAGEPGSTPTPSASLATLSAAYAARLPGRFEELREAVEEAHSGVAGAFAEALARVHKLAGSAGPYGQPEVSTAACRLEDALRSIQDEDPTAAGWEQVLAELDALTSLPETRASEPPVPEPPAPEPSSFTPTFLALSPIGTVLVVDEDPELLGAVERLANAHLVGLVSARSAAEALGAARQHRLDGAFIHLHVGGTEGGLRLAERLRSLEGQEALPLAFFSSGSALPDRLSAVHAGASLFLPRPFSGQELAAGVSHMVAARAPKPARILLVDDDVEFLRSVAGLLSLEGYQVQELEEPARLLEALSAWRPDLVVLDVMLPGPSGFDLCRILRSMPEWEHLPILVASARLEDSVRVEAFRAGADDSLVKPIQQEELLARVRGRLERARLARERSERDALTGLPLRRAFLQQARARLAEARRSSEPLSLCLLDVDRFKAINDTHGHLVGDCVLSRLGRLLEARFRQEDVRGRWGGEEFVVLLSGEKAPAASEILLRTKAQFSRLWFDSTGGRRFQATLSAGVASFPADGTTVEELLRVADERLYRAKANGRDRVEHA
ncbi:MAG: response regulator [Myxococcaceae bacterium]|nr:response regulator [Myxococcaceae bacterium]